MYKSPRDPQIKRDIQMIEKTCLNFSKKWNNNKDYLSDKKTLLKVLCEYEHIYTLMKWQKPLWYFQLLNDMKSNDAFASSQVTMIDQLTTKSWNHVLFFALNLGTIEKSFQEKILKDQDFKTYHYFLKRIFDRAKYMLSEAEEKVLNNMDIASYTMWVDGVEKQLGAQKISFKGRTIGLGEAANIMRSLSRDARISLHNKVQDCLRITAPFAEAEINAVVTGKKISDEMRKYNHPTSSTILGYENDEKSVHILAKIVTKSFPVSHRFYAIKKKMLKITGKLASVDINASVGAIKQIFDFKEAVDLTRKSFAQADPEFARILDDYLKNGQIDVFPRLNKRSGAYCWGHVDLPTYVLLNHVPSFDSVKTLAHEMGHAVHTEFSKSQPIFYQGHSTATAEVASTLFENFVFDEIKKTLSPQEQMIALHNKVADSIATIFRQIAFFNFEMELHEAIRKNGFIAERNISEMMNKHLKSYVGPHLSLNADDGLFWIRLSHIRSYFYVYTYAYGQLVSQALYAEYSKNPAFITKIKQFLSAGRSDTPENIFKSIGIDTTKPEFWMKGIKSVENDIKELEQMVKKLSKKPTKKK